MVKLELTLSPDEVITGASLHVLRTFIASNSANAGDLVKSFVYHGSDSHVGELANEIMARSLRNSSQPVIVRGDGPSVSGAPSPAYLVYAGERERAEVGNLMLENRGDEFVVTLAPSGSKPKNWFARLFK